MTLQMFKLPDPGEGLVEADIVTWKVKVGDEVATNDIVVEIETAKSLVELPIPWAGTITEIFVEEGATVEVGTPIVAVEVAGTAAADPAEVTTPTAEAPEEKDDEPEERTPHLVGYGSAPAPTARRARKSAHAAPPAPQAPSPPPVAPARSIAAKVAAPAVEDAVAAAAPTTGGKALAKPPVRKFAKDHGVDLSQVTPSAESGIVSRADVEQFLANDAASSSDSTPSAPVESGARESRTPVKGVRKLTADAMRSSAFTAPHVTEFVTVDVTAMMDLVARLRTDREFTGLKVTPLTVLAKAMCLAIRRNPGINATWQELPDGSAEIVTKHYVNLGIAAATPRGLVVPNVKGADAMSMLELAQAIGGLTSTARDGRTPPSDMTGGTITITNVGVFGVDTGTPIINPGEAAILCFGAIRKMPWVVTDAEGHDAIVPRQVTQLAVSFDHRLVDGDLGSRFLADVAALLEDPARALVWG